MVSDLTVLQHSEFTPVLLREHAGQITEEFPTLTKAMDLFYSKLESDKNVGSTTFLYQRLISAVSLRSKSLRRSNERFLARRNDCAGEYCVQYIALWSTNLYTTEIAFHAKPNSTKPSVRLSSNPFCFIVISTYLFFSRLEHVSCLSNRVSSRVCRFCDICHSGRAGFHIWKIVFLTFCHRLRLPLALTGTS